MLSILIAAVQAAVDAIVAAFAGARPESVVLTSDPLDLRALAEHPAVPISIVGVS